MKRALHESCSREESKTPIDEQLSALGYTVSSSDMSNVADKLHQLDIAMNTFNSDLPFNTVHHNPSDISAWLDNMLSELDPPTAAIQSRDPKRAKISPPVSAPNPVVIVAADPQEAGIRLVHALLACAESVQQEDYGAAAAILKQISILSSAQAGAMRRVSGCFAEALARRIYRPNPNQDSPLESAFIDILEMHFYESSPYLKFAHFTANQSILEAFSGRGRVHVVDLGIKQGLQWPALMQALALRPGGPPSFRLTGISNSDDLHRVGFKLAQLAQSIHLNFEYRSLITPNLAEIEPFLLQSDESETLAINSIFELHSLLAVPGSLEKLLSTIHSLRPAILTVAEQEANHNSGEFLRRFTESLHYYSAVFDSLEEVSDSMSEVYLGRQIGNVVACEGAERTERHEMFARWRMRIESAGFEMMNFGSNAFKQASMLLGLFAGGEGYKVEEKEGCLALGWHTRPLIVSSGWCVAGGGGGGGGGAGAGGGDRDEAV